MKKILFLLIIVTFSVKAQLTGKFFDIGAGGSASVSKNGVFATASNYPYPAFRWSESTGTVYLGNLFAEGWQVANNGTVAGRFRDTTLLFDGEPVLAAGYYKDNKWTRLKEVSGEAPLNAVTYTNAYAINAEGTKVVGMVWHPNWRVEASYWSIPDTGIGLLGQVNGRNSKAQGLNASGSIMVGWNAAAVSGPDRMSCYWDPSPHFIGAYDTTYPVGEIHATNSQGSIMVGVSANVAFTYTQSNGMQFLTEPPVYSEGSALGVSDNGTVVGYAVLAGENTPIAFIKKSGWQNILFLKSYLIDSLHVQGINAWELTYARGISTDGKTIGGCGFPTPTSAVHSFVVRIDQETPAAINWQNSIVFHDNGIGSKTITFGTALTATDGIDTALGEMDLPPVPPATAIDARFILPVNPPAASLKDFRSDSLSQAVWHLDFQPGSGDYPVTLAWDTTSLPEGTFLLKDAINGTTFTVNMKSQGSVTITNPAINAVIIEYSKLVCGNISLSAGWNMVSVPVTAASMATTALFPQATSQLFGFNNGYTATENAETGKGYWLRYPQEITLPVCGIPYSGNGVPVLQGWNMIGPYKNDITVSAITTTPPGILTSSFFGYSNGYNTPLTLASGRGYWIRASQDGVINTASVSKHENVIAQSFVTNAAKVHVTDASGKTVALYLIQQGTTSNLQTFDLPPVPPEGVFDVRFSTQKYGETVGAKSQIIAIQGAEYPLTLKPEGCMITLKDCATDGKLVNCTLADKQPYILSNQSITSIEIQSDLQNVEFELFQNYPNPFNPATMFRFSLPAKTRVNLAVFDQLGQMVAELVNTEMEPGYHEYEWNASGIASGVYIYRLKTENFSSVKKLIFMK